MTLSELGSGFGLVPLKETNVRHVLAPERVGRRQRVLRARCLAAMYDPMAIQAAMILRGALVDMRQAEGAR